RADHGGRARGIGATRPARSGQAARSTRGPGAAATLDPDREPHRAGPDVAAHGHPPAAGLDEAKPRAPLVARSLPVALGVVVRTPAQRVGLDAVRTGDFEARRAGAAHPPDDL